MTVAVVTGASSGLGEATARLLAREHGAALVLVARREDRLRALAERARRQRQLLRRRPHRRRRARARARARRGAPRAGSTCSSTTPARRGAATFADGGWENVKRHMEVNFDAVVRLTEALLPLLRRSAPSAIVNVSSTAGRVARPGSGAYSASKFALAGWSDALAGEEAPNGVHVGLVLPGLHHHRGLPAVRAQRQPAHAPAGLDAGARRAGDPRRRAEREGRALRAAAVRARRRTARA